MERFPQQLRAIDTEPLRPPLRLGCLLIVYPKAQHCHTNMIHRMTYRSTYAFSTLPAFRQEVHTLMRRELAPWRTRTRWMLGSQRRLDRRWEWLTCRPTQGLLPQTSQR